MTTFLLILVGTAAVIFLDALTPDGGLPVIILIGIVLILSAVGCSIHYHKTDGGEPWDFKK